MSRKEQAAREREVHAHGNPDVSIDKQKRLQEERELAQQEAEKVSGMFHLLLNVCPSIGLHWFHMIKGTRWSL